MTRAVTIRLPAASVLGRLVVVALVLALVLWAGLRFGSSLLFGDPIVRIARGDEIQEIGTADGTFLGRIVAVDSGQVRVADPAFLRSAPQPSAGATPGPQFIIQPLSAVPNLIDGDIVIPISTITIVGSIQSGSELEAVYRQAINGQTSGPPLTSPSPR